MWKAAIALIIASTVLECAAEILKTRAAIMERSMKND